VEIYALGGILQYLHNSSLLSHSLTHVNSYQNSSRVGYFPPPRAFLVCTLDTDIMQVFRQFEIKAVHFHLYVSMWKSEGISIKLSGTRIRRHLCGHGGLESEENKFFAPALQFLYY